MVINIEIRNTLRNIRFLLFTIVFPSVFFILLINSEKSFSDGMGSLNPGFWVIFASIIGVAGNALITFSKTIRQTLKFYQLQNKVTRYSLFCWMRDQLIIQTILHFLICVTVVFTALNSELFSSLLFVLVFGIYLCVIGFCLALILDSHTLDALSAPIMVVVNFLLIPFHLFAQGTAFEVITTIQRVFPGYYLINTIKQIFVNQNFWPSMGLFWIVLIIHIGLLFIIINILSKRQKN